MIKLLAFVASIISGAQVDAVYANHQLRGVLKDPFVPRRLDHDANVCGQIILEGAEYQVHQFSAGLCEVDADPGSSHPEPGFGEAEICFCYSNCKKDLCCTGNEGEDDANYDACMSRPVQDEIGCTWEPDDDKVGQSCTPDDDTDDVYHPDCRDPICNNLGYCQYVAKADGTFCGDPTETQCNGRDTCKNGLCEANLHEGDPCDDDDVNIDECNDGKCNAEGFCVEDPKTGDPCISVVDQCNDGVCNDSGVCVEAPLTGDPCSAPGVNDECNDGVCSAAGVCVKDPKTDGTLCGDPESQCQEGDYCFNGVCEYGLVREGDRCSICGVCSADADCYAVCGDGDKYEGLSFVVRCNDEYYDGNVYLGCTSVPEVLSPSSTTLDVAPVYTIDSSNGCALPRGHTNNIEIKVYPDSQYTSIHTSCSQPATGICMRIDDGCGLYFVGGVVRDSGVEFLDTGLPDWNLLDCNEDQPGNC